MVTGVTFLAVFLDGLAFFAAVKGVVPDFAGELLLSTRALALDEISSNQASISSPEDVGTDVPVEPLHEVDGFAALEIFGFFFGLGAPNNFFMSPSSDFLDETDDAV